MDLLRSRAFIAGDDLVQERRASLALNTKCIDGFRFPFALLRVQRHHDSKLGDAVLGTAIAVRHSLQTQAGQQLRSTKSDFRILSSVAQNHRLTFLIVNEPAQGLSTRKLLIETAKHNVITAYSGEEGLGMLERFPNVDAVAVDVTLEDMRCEEFIKEVEKRNSRIKIVALSPNKIRFDCGNAEVVSSHDPAELLKLLETLGGPSKI